MSNLIFLFVLFLDKKQLLLTVNILLKSMLELDLKDKAVKDNTLCSKDANTILSTIKSQFSVSETKCDFESD